VTQEHVGAASVTFLASGAQNATRPERTARRGPFRAGHRGSRPSRPTRPDGPGRRCKTGRKATIYRRFPDKHALVRAAIAALNPVVGELPDHGSLREDLLAMFRATYSDALDRQTATFAPRLLAESASEPEMHAIFREALIEPRREAVRRVLRRGVERGELAADADLELVIDLLAGPIIYRVLIDGGRLEGVAGRMEAMLDAVLHGVARR
jgi:AcrR family transcriptional regulator